MELGLAATSRRYAGYVLRSFFKFCRHIRVITDDPAADLTPVTIPKRLPVYLDSSEVQLFLDRHDIVLRYLVNVRPESDFEAFF